MTAFEPRWLGMDGIFGGYVLGRVVDAADCVSGFVPQSVTMTFVGAVRPGEVRLTVEPVHRGRSTVSLRVELHQESRLLVHATASLVPTGQETTWSSRSDLPGRGGPQSCPPYEPAHRRLSYGDHLEIREAHTASLEAGAAAWVRLTDGSRERVGLGRHALAALFLDVLPPGLFALDPSPVFVPTIDFTVHFSALLGELSRDWFMVANTTLWATRDFCTDESVLYDAEGRRLAQVRQGRAVRWRS